jgi:hypothetical protein
VKQFCDLKYLLIGFAMVLLFTGCSANKHIVNTFVSPDTTIEAVVVKTNGGATTSYGIEVYLFNKENHSKKLSNPVFLADKVSEYKICWKDSDSLEISYPVARIFHFTNFWPYFKNKVYQHDVKILLKQNYYLENPSILD